MLILCVGPLEHLQNRDLGPSENLQNRDLGPLENSQNRDFKHLAYFLLSTASHKRLQTEAG